MSLLEHMGRITLAEDEEGGTGGRVPRWLPYAGLARRLRPLARLCRPYRGLLIASMLAGVGRSAFATAAAFAGSLLAGEAITAAAPGRIKETFAVLLALVLPTVAFGAADLQFCHRLSFRLLADLRKAIYAQLERLAPAYLLQRRSGDIAVAAMSDIELLELFTSHVLPVIAVAVLVPLAGIIAIGVLSPLLALSLAPFVLAVATVPAWFGRRAEEQGRGIRESTAVLSADVVDAVQGVREIIILGAQQQTLDRLAGQQAALTAVATAHGRRAGLEKAAGDGLTGLGLLAVVAVATLLMSRHQLAEADYPAAVVLAAACFLPLAEISGIGRELNRVAAASDRIGRLLAARPAVTDRAATDRAATVPRLVTAAVAFEQVSFRYKPSLPPALREVSFTIEPGEAVALVGHSGAGKSTCANLLLRLWDPAAGRITLGGHDLRDFAQDDLRGRIAYVPQDVYLFNVSVTENLRLGRVDASDAEIRRAAELAQCTEFIEALPRGWDTVLGERGIRLSGGERQRLAIARALLKDAPVLVLDEAVSSLDTESEHALRLALSQVMRDRTTLVIAHRPSTIQAADRLVVLDHGQVAETGTYARLAGAGGVFQAMISAGLPG
jgi:ATP-binding cassette, subfamily C, bacterial CydC